MARARVALGLLLFIVLAGAGAWLWTRGGRGAALFADRPHTFTEELPAKAAPAAPRVTIVSERGNIAVVATDDLEVRVTAKKTAYARNQDAAQTAAGRVQISLTDHSDGSFQVQSAGEEALGEQGELSIELRVPRQAILNATTEAGDVRAAGVLGGVAAETGSGLIDIRDSGGEVSVSQIQGDVHIVGAAGNVKVTGRGNLLEIAGVKGSVSIEAPFFGAVRLSRIEGAVHLLSARIDLNLTHLDGNIETSTDALKILNTSGDLTLRAQDCEVRIENSRGRIQIAGYGADLQLIYSESPRAEVLIDSRSADISVSLPTNANFRVNAQTLDGNLTSDFPRPEVGGDPEDNNLVLYGQVGSGGPWIQIRSTYGDISIRRSGP